MEEAIIEEVTEDGIIICLSVRNKCFSEDREAGRELRIRKSLFVIKTYFITVSCCCYPDFPDEMEADLVVRRSWSLAVEADRGEETFG